MLQRNTSEFDSWVIGDGDTVELAKRNYELGEHETICCTVKPTLAEIMFENREIWKPEFPVEVN